jgi:hypothetical protein
LAMVQPRAVVGCVARGQKATGVDAGRGPHAAIVKSLQMYR